MTTVEAKDIKPGDWVRWNLATRTVTSVRFSEVYRDHLDIDFDPLPGHPYGVLLNEKYRFELVNPHDIPADEDKIMLNGVEVWATLKSDGTVMLEVDYPASDASPTIYVNGERAW